MKQKQRRISLLLTVLLIMGLLPSMVLAEPATLQANADIYYVSENGNGNKDGSDEANAMDMSSVRSLTGDIEIKVVGTITLHEEMPAANITFTGADEKATVKNGNYVSFNGDTTFDNVNYDAGRFTYMFANGHHLLFKKTVNATANGLSVFGGGNQKEIIGNPTITIQTDMKGAKVFGGGWDGDLNGNPTINIEGATLSNVYGGGYAKSKNAKVTGNPTINLEESSFTGANYINGGGFVELFSYLNADVTGKVTIKADNCSMNGSGDLYLGSRINAQNSSATIGELEVEIKNSELGKRVFGGSCCNGESSKADIGKIFVRFDNTKVNGEVYAGGYTDGNKTSSSRGDDVTFVFENSSAVNFFAGGYGVGADVEKANVTVKNIEDVIIFAGGYKDGSKVENCVINIENASSKGSAYNMVINGGGGTTSAGKLHKTVKNLVVNFLGNNEVKTIRMVDNIYIKEGAVLNQLDAKNSLLSDKDLNGHLTVEKDAKLVLKGNNEISGNFHSEGNLTNEYQSRLLVGEKVTSDSSASYTSTNFKQTYEKSYPFLAAKVDDTEVAGFLSTNPSYFVNNRVSGADGFQTPGAQREWYLDKNIYKVDFIENGGTTVLDLSEVTKGATISEPLTSKDGYTLLGWYKEEIFENQWNFAKDTVESDLTLYARWNATPEITAEDQTLTVGDKFDPRANVNAFDTEDGELTDKIEILKNEVDPSKVGVYEVTYKVTDSQGAFSTKTIQITVADKGTEPTTPTAPPEPTDPNKENPHTGTEVPKTGDSSNIVLWLVLLMASAGVLMGAVLYSRRKKTNP